MTPDQEKQLIADVRALKQQMAGQVSHTILLLAIAKIKGCPHPGNIKDEIDRFPLPDETDADEIRKQAKQLAEFYFPLSND